MSEFISTLTQAFVNAGDNVLQLIHPDELSSQEEECQQPECQQPVVLDKDHDHDKDVDDVDDLILTPSTESPVPYDVSPQHIYSTSINSTCYDKTVVDDIVYIGMCDLYGKVVPQRTVDEDDIWKMMPDEPHTPYHTYLSEQSYTYTSEYEHNRLVVQIFNYTPANFWGTRIIVSFTMTPKYSPTVESDNEARKIDECVLDVIYNRLYDHFEYAKDEEHQLTHQYDEHSYHAQEMM